MINIEPEIQQKLKSVNIKLDTIIKAGTNKKIHIKPYIITSLMEDLSFVIGKLSFIYENLAQTIINNTKQKN